MAASAGLAWSLANGITEEQYYKNLAEALTIATSKGMSDTAIAKEMEKYGISAKDLATATGVSTEVVQTKIDAATKPGLLETPDVATPEAPTGGGGLLTTPTVTAPAVTAPVVTAPVTAPVVTTPEVKLPTTPITINAPPVTAPVVTAPVVTAPVVTTPAVTAGGGGLLTTATPTRSARDQSLVDFFTANQSKYDLGTFKTELDKLGYTAEDVARVTGTPLAEVKRQYEVAVSTPTTPYKPYVAPATPATPVTPTTPVTPPVVTPPVVTAPVTPTTPTRSLALTWSLNNGLTEEQYYKKVREDYKRAVDLKLTDAQIKSTMEQYGISAADLATATGSDLKTVEERVTKAVPKTPEEIAYDKAAKAELAAREAKAAAEKKANDAAWAEKQRLNKIADEEQQRKNALDYAAQQKALADAERAKLDALRTPETNPFINAGPINPELPPSQVGFTQPTQPETGPLTFEENLKNYQSIPVGAQYNPYAVGGTGSPYSQIMGQAKPLGNPYANALAGQSMGGFNPALYAQAAATYKAEADAAAAAAAADPGQISDGLAKGGMVHGGLMFGPNPAGPDDGAVNLDLGEYVIKKSSVNKYGKGLLDMINQGKIPAKKIRSLLD
jgi:antitoxin component HigA of HigAB toxin-antitoxin module